MPTPKEEYAKKLAEIARRYVDLEDDTVRQMVETLQELRQQIATQLTSASGFEAYRLKELLQNINRLLDEFGARLTANVRGEFTQAYDLGGLSVVEPLQAIMTMAFYATNPALLNTILDFSADLIKNITDEMRGKINAQIRLASLGQQSPLSVMKQITGILGVEATAGVWGQRRRPQVVKGVAARAETILRTEMARTFNLSAHSQQLAAAKQEPGLLKRWIATGDNRTRASHLAAHVYYTANPIPVDQAFVVGGAKLMFPGDPAGPAQETINCRCRDQVIHPLVGVVEAPLDKLVADEQKRREKPKEE